MEKFFDLMDPVFEFIFSFNMVLVLICAGFIFTMYTVIDVSNQSQAETQRLTEACYSQGMVLVQTDAGQLCADPRSLVKVK
jgi:hypothetical protein